MSHSIRAFRAAQEQFDREEAARLVEQVQEEASRGRSSLRLLGELPLGAVEQALELLTAGGLETVEAFAPEWGLNVGWLSQVTFTWQGKRHLTVVC